MKSNLAVQCARGLVSRARGVGLGARGRAALAVTAVAMAGCGPLIKGGSPGEEASSTTEDPLSSSTTSGRESDSAAGPGTSTTSTTATVPQTSTSDGETTGPQGSSTTVAETDPGAVSSFIVPPDNGSMWNECDQWVQDCPVGQKCTAWANDGGNAWNATRCVPVVDDPDDVGEPCTVEESASSGVDSCDVGQLCWLGQPDTLTGVCRAFCSGTMAVPVCPPAHLCPLAGDGVLTICQPECDPLVQDCGEGEGCYSLSFGGGLVFGCAPDASGDEGNFGEPCEFINGCSIGLLCETADALVDCEAGACCTTFCDASQVASCPAGYTCNPFHSPGNAPPDEENYGYCISV